MLPKKSPRREKKSLNEGGKWPISSFMEGFFCCNGNRKANFSVITIFCKNRPGGVTWARSIRRGVISVVWNLTLLGQVALVPGRMGWIFGNESLGKVDAER